MLNFHDPKKLFAGLRIAKNGVMYEKNTTRFYFFSLFISEVIQKYNPLNRIKMTERIAKVTVAPLVPADTDIPKNIKPMTSIEIGTL